MTDPRDQVAAVDEYVGRLVPNVRPPAIRRRDAVLVTGPWLAGSSSLVAVLRERLPDVTFVEADELRQGEAAVAVVFVVSAVAPLTDSDCAVLDTAAAHTDLVIGAVSKIDVHRGWRQLLKLDSAALTAFDSRYKSMPWVGVAAAPDLGDTQCADLVSELESGLADPTLVRRNRLRAWDFRLRSTIRRYEIEAGRDPGVGHGARVNALHKMRADTVRQTRVAKSERTIALRSQIQQARVQLSYFARNRCASVRTELQEDAAEMTRAKLPAFEGYVWQRINGVIDEVDDGIAEHLADVSTELGLPLDSSMPPMPLRAEAGAPPLKSRRLETRLMIVLGAGFGLGVALTLSRLFADLAPGLAVAGVIGCAALGVLVTAWIVGIRGLLHDRAVLDRWVGEVTTALRTTVDQRVATRVLAAEMSMTSALNHQVESSTARVADRVKQIDDELREHALSRARAMAVRDRESPVVHEALVAIQAELSAGLQNTAVTNADKSSATEAPPAAVNGRTVDPTTVAGLSDGATTVVAGHDPKEG